MSIKDFYLEETNEQDMCNTCFNRFSECTCSEDIKEIFKNKTKVDYKKVQILVGNFANVEEIAFKLSLKCGGVKISKILGRLNDFRYVRYCPDAEVICNLHDLDYYTTIKECEFIK